MLVGLTGSVAMKTANSLRTRWLQGGMAAVIAHPPKMRDTALVMWAPGPQQPAREKAREKSSHSDLKVSLPLAGGQQQHLGMCRRSFRSIQQLMAGEAQGGLGGAVSFWKCSPSTSPSICFLMSPRGQEEASKPKSTLHISEIMVI